VPDQLLLGDELHAFEPALSSKVTAGFLIEEQWHVRAHTLIEGLGAWLRLAGVEIRESARVVGFDTTDGVVGSLRTTGGQVVADAFVLAAGAWTQTLARQLGAAFPMQPGKGYSFLVKPKLMPRHGILFADIHAGATPLGDRVRIAGTMEFSGYDLSIDRKRVDNLFHLARDYIELEEPVYEEPWAGLRPLPPDGLPVLDFAHPFSNAYIATGYSMLGMTIGPTAGKALAHMIVTGERTPVLEPFRIDRFRSILRRRRALEGLRPGT
jgi:D-amino-acid dehydrogenase